MVANDTQIEAQMQQEAAAAVEGHQGPGFYRSRILQMVPKAISSLKDILESDEDPKIRIAAAAEIRKWRDLDGQVHELRDPTESATIPKAPEHEKNDRQKERE